MRVLIVGFGSIGRRHTENLLALGVSDIVLLRTRGSGNDHGLAEVRSWSQARELNPGAVVICTPTGRHIADLAEVLPMGCAVLCEKPIVATRDDMERLHGLLAAYPGGLSRVALNMRFHPVVAKARALLESEIVGRVYFSRFEVGQYLPDWRPGVNHLECYSANRSMGGGVVLDLIHELDMAEYLLGTPTAEPSACILRAGDVTVDTEDIAEICYPCDQGLVSVHLDYLYRGYCRGFEVRGNKGHLTADLHTAELRYCETGTTVNQSWDFPAFERNSMYRDLMTAFLADVREPQSQASILPTLTEAVSVMNTAIKAIDSYA